MAKNPFPALDVLFSTWATTPIVWPSTITGLLTSKMEKFASVPEITKPAGCPKPITLEVDEFIRRFLQYVLPCGFCKIRYFGFMAICNIKTKLELCFTLIEKPAYLPQYEGLPSLDVWRCITGKDLLICPTCKTGRMVSNIVERIK